MDSKRKITVIFPRGNVKLRKADRNIENSTKKANLTATTASIERMNE